jgi:two-component system, OmpR family, sensor histidine kinase QseC
LKSAAARWSLRTWLVLLLGGTTLLAWIASSAWLYQRALVESNALFDAALVEAAHAVIAVATVERERRHRGRGRDHDDDDDTEVELARVDHHHVERIFYHVRDERGVILFRSAGSPGTPLGALHASGFADRTVEGTDWRVYSQPSAGGTLQIDVGQRLADRRALARGGATRLLMPGFALVLLLAAGTWFIVRRVTARVDGFARAIDAHALESRTPVPTEALPAELVPIGHAVNNLLDRAEAALRHERTLTADAAHELRTPLAALRAQAQVALREPDPQRRAEALKALIGGVDRAAGAVESVLALARLDARNLDARERVSVSLVQLARLLVGDFAESAARRHVTLETQIADDVQSVPGDADALAVLLRNLLENAVRHAHARVRIEARRNGDRVLLAVRDDGDGMTPEQASRAFDRFYRAGGGAGSGLGLAIVQRVAHLHDGTARLAGGLDGRGVGIEIDLPANLPAG